MKLIIVSRFYLTLQNGSGRMKNRVCIIGSGPTGIYTLKNLVTSKKPLDITIYEAEKVAGKGTPYLPGINDPVMLSNIPSIEIPLISQPLVNWLRERPEEYLADFGIVRSEINERQFYPRIVLGDYFHQQFLFLVSLAEENGHKVNIKAGQKVTDIVVQLEEIRVIAQASETFGTTFDHVVIATGHDWPETTEAKPGYFISPWPATALEKIGSGRLGILGTSLSAIDALMTVSTSTGIFMYDEAGSLTYKPADNNFHATLMSRKGLLPEADFFCPLPYETPKVCTTEAINELISRGSSGLLDATFELFRQELFSADPGYAAEIGLSDLTVDNFAEAYYARRSSADPFAWAALNLAEAQQNMAAKFTVPWRYAIMITHEIIAKIVPHLDQTDFNRFSRSFKSIFIDEYATVPHLSIQRLLALHNAGALEIQKLGEGYEISTDGVDRGAVVKLEGETLFFDTFIDATGQSARSAKEIPFQTLVSKGIVREAPTPADADLYPTQELHGVARFGGIDVDEHYRIRSEGSLQTQLYCAAIPYLLHKHPFIQGITSAAEIGETVAVSILEDLARADRFELLSA